MPTDARRRAFRKRWNVQLSEQEEFGRFRNRLLMELTPVIGRLGYTDTLPKFDDRFSYYVGRTGYHREFGWPDPLQDRFSQTDLYQCMNKAEDLQHLGEAIQAMFWALEEDAYIAQLGADDAAPAAFHLTHRSVVSISPTHYRAGSLTCQDVCLCVAG